MILAGDVGGTKCNLALFAEKNRKLEVVFRERFASKEFAQFDLIIKEFSRRAAPHLGASKIRAAGFGVAGPVINNRIHATNLPWIVDADTLSKEVGVESIVLINDLGATGHSLEHLPPEDFCVQQIELLKFMRHRYPQVSWELILSGRGFRTLHEFIAPSVKHPIFEDPDADPAPFITKSGLDKSCPICVQTLDLWTSVYGAEAGNLALKVLALGGVYVAGGIAVKILPKMTDGTFFNSFKDKWHFTNMLADVPLSIVLNESAPLIGAAYEAYATVK